MSTIQKTEINRFKRIHLYYKYTGFYSFLGSSLKKAALPILGFIIGIIILDLYVIDFNKVFTFITETYSTWSILLVFLISESLLGLVPPEIFIAWADKTSMPILNLTFLATISYLGGIISYFIGKWILRIPVVFNYVEIKMKKHLNQIRKWGGFLIVVGALLPIPYSITSMAAGTINYSFKNYLLFGLLRFLRFYLYAIAIFSLF